MCLTSHSLCAAPHTQTGDPASQCCLVAAPYSPQRLHSWTHIEVSLLLKRLAKLAGRFFLGDRSGFADYFVSNADQRGDPLGDLLTGQTYLFIEQRWLAVRDVTVR